ncbi:Phospholipid hydroperoxide glutathione peroxidase [Phytophthora cinnamomi]|uniref:Phospholipid hydroperoxide glutathione peroxidase n=1 Tax=Phytophthora cinnamomi TaxID=4785 RepID=UPI003559FB35|nr:Phospholipid hydroperoxide glutathione peroxidase [Phytophthora cinnamomi]
MTSDGCASLLLLALSWLSVSVGVQALALDVPGLKAALEAACPYMYLGCAVGASEAPATDGQFPSEMPLLLDGETIERKYPAFPHAPLLVAAGTSDAVVLRWRSFETLLWPVQRFVLQRYPDGDNQPQWSTLLDSNALQFVDLDVQPGQKYAYRVQAICSDNVSSAYDYHWTQVDGAHGGSTSVCRTSAALLGSVGTLNAEGIRSLGLIFACFLTVYGLMRASVMGVQGSQSRSYRLKRIKKSTSEVVAPAVSVSTGQGVTMMPRRSSTSTSSSSPSIEVDPSQRDSMFDAAPSNTAALSGALTRAHSSTDAMQTPLPATFRPMSRSIGAIEENATSCQHCGKRFGLFRKRYMCDICHSVSLCRKCGYQASVDSFANARTGMQMNSVGSSRNAGGRGMGRRRSSLSQQQQKKLKIRTICRNCCDDMYRYSTHASVRPSYAPSA